MSGSARGPLPPPADLFPPADPDMPVNSKRPTAIHARNVRWVTQPRGSYMKRLIAVGLGLAALAGVGCSSTTQDLEGIDAIHPQKTEVYQQPDGFPNVGRTCIDGVAFFITTRDYSPVERVPEWDDWCGTKAGD